MTRRATLVILVAIAVSLPALGEGFEILPPNTTAYSPTEVATLEGAIATLRGVLNDYDLGAYRYFDPSEWQSLDFAAYTAGTLAGLGYETRLIEEEGWADGKHTWVIVGIPLDGRTAWVPVEASPEIGKRQAILGTIPSYTDSAGRLWFEAAYLSFSSEVTLPPNRSPLAAIRVVPSWEIVGREVTFMAVTSYDPDGEIIRYHWDLGGISTSEAKTVRLAFPAEGTYSINLTVTDSRGASTSTKIDYRVKEPGESPPPSGCGCGN
jgi:hypothetical protein